MSSFCSAKATHICSAKNIRILCIESAKTVNEMTLNELVKLTTLWSTGPRSFALFHFNGFFIVCDDSSRAVSSGSTRYLIWSAELKGFIVKLRAHSLKRKNLITVEREKLKKTEDCGKLKSSRLSYDKSQKGLPLETKNTQNHENRRLGLIEFLHMQHCSLRSYENLSCVII